MVVEQTPISTNDTEISGTIRATYYKNGERNIEENVKRGLGYEGVIEPQVIQKCGDRDNDGTYSIHNYSNCIPANPMSDRGQLVLEPVIVASRGRDPENPSNRKAGSNYEQRLEIKSDGITNTITSVQKDNYVLEPDKVGIKQATKKGYIECYMGGVADFSYPESDKRRGRVQGDGYISPTITGNIGICRIERGKNMGYRIRKLTEKECWRLMDFSDEDFAKAASVNSKTQLYKEAGNSIVCNVLVAILGQLFIDKENLYKNHGE